MASGHDLHDLLATEHTAVDDTIVDTPISGEGAFQDKYEILGKIGEGAQGVVLKVRRKSDGELFAAKKLKSPTLETIEQFERDFQARAAVHDDGIVQAVECFSWEDTTYSENWFMSVMELVSGKTLAEHMGAHKRFDEAELVTIMDQTLEALAEAHSHGIVHRDIKPSNLMMTDTDGRIKVTDFELAKLLGHETRLGSMGKGSLVYMAPEQLTGGKITPATDYCGLGLTLIALARGAELEQDMITKDPRDYLRNMTHLSPEFKASLECMIDHDPEKRLNWKNPAQPMTWSADTKRPSSVIGRAYNVFIGSILGFSAGSLSGLALYEALFTAHPALALATMIATPLLTTAGGSVLGYRTGKKTEERTYGPALPKADIPDTLALPATCDMDEAAKKDAQRLLEVFGFLESKDEPDIARVIDSPVINLVLGITSDRSPEAQRLTAALCEYVPWLKWHRVMNEFEAARDLMSALDFEPLTILSGRRGLAHPDYAIVYYHFKEEIVQYAQKTDGVEPNAMYVIMEIVRDMDPAILLKPDEVIRIKDRIKQNMDGMVHGYTIGHLNGKGTVLHDVPRLQARNGGVDISRLCKVLGCGIIDPEDEELAEILDLKVDRLAGKLSKTRGRRAQRFTDALCMYIPWLEKNLDMERQDIAHTLIRSFHDRPFEVNPTIVSVVHPDYAVVYAMFREQVEQYANASGEGEIKALKDIYDLVRRHDPQLVLEELRVRRIKVQIASTIVTAYMGPPGREPYLPSATDETPGPEWAAIPGQFKRN